jgi:hypothetical protein
MTLLLPYLFHFIIKISLIAANTINYTVEYLERDFPDELFGWLGYILNPPITATLVNCFAFLHGIILVPIYFWN